MSEALTKDKFLSPKEYDQLQATLLRFQEKNPRDVAMIFISMHTGARPSEVLGIMKKDLDFENKKVFVKGLKGSRSREIPLPPGVFSQLAAIARDTSNPNDKIFPVCLRTFQHIWHQYRPVEKGLRSLRHTFALRLYEKTRDIRLVQLALGHKFLNTTQIYTEYVYSNEELKRLIL